MHNQEHTNYQDLVPDVVAYLKQRVETALAAGIAWENIIIDPGIGFGKTWEQSLELLRRLDELKTIGHPILLGTSRKGFIGRVLDLPPEDRVEGTGATVALGIAKGADMVRVHDVREMARVCRMTDAIVRGVITPIPAPGEV
ncbi:MAG: dihydropteroate synthase [Dehalococcoidia bacterium]|nr:dihydropteroate synthase [Dehalococcoidia bacterium]